MFALLLALGMVYLGAFTVFVTDSRDFVIERINSEARDRAAGRVVSLPATLVIAIESDDRHMLGAGWHPVERAGVWSSSTDAWVYLPLPASEQPVEILVRGRTFVTRAMPSMSVTLHADGVVLGTWSTDRSVPAVALAARIPRELLTGEPLALRIQVDHVASPRRLGVGPADRPHGFWLEQIEMSSDNP